MYAFLMALCAILPFSWIVVTSRTRSTKKPVSVDLSACNERLWADTRAEFTADEHPVATKLPRLLW